MSRRCSTRFSTPATRAARRARSAASSRSAPNCATPSARACPLLMHSQLEQVFGGPLEGREHFYQDWADDAETCSALDRERGREEARTTANPMLRRPLWGGQAASGRLGDRLATGRLYGGRAGGGAAHRARHCPRHGGRGRTSTSPARARASTRPACAVSRPGSSGRARALFDDYRRRMNASLATQAREQITQRAMLGAAEAFFGRGPGEAASSAFRSGAASRSRRAAAP